MALQETEVNLPYAELQALCRQREAAIDGLRQQVAALERERDEARQGLEQLTKALRRRGCCEP